MSGRCACIWRNRFSCEIPVVGFKRLLPVVPFRWLLCCGEGRRSRDKNPPFCVTLLQSGGRTIVSYPLPLVHGMTVGELARLFNDRLGIGADLVVVPMAQYRRAMRYGDTGLGWVPISPNLRDAEALSLYADVGLVEGAEVSVGRGTAMPFRVVGAPWIDAQALARELNALDTGAIFRPTRFVPAEGQHRGTLCAGVSIQRSDIGHPRLVRRRAAATYPGRPPARREPGPVARSGIRSSRRRADAHVRFRCAPSSHPRPVRRTDGRRGPVRCARQAAPRPASRTTAPATGP